ncbi:MULTISPECIES: hypothetical protein [Flavobacterium]|uniref:Uncharacterized protein n=1 Tax=Flavobacterium columnare TaxID=996 RepID=A0AA94F3V1_9FLAO|nr:hypothetical protein [Flavobacterium columnare]MCH4830028.1 hypothetical protein [Flavobacterium columnare]MCH4832591.1 hypothetical protein [Flavobacterium columnare]MEB3799677.1 hypothetical protein [Flavobacterium columnare]
MKLYKSRKIRGHWHFDNSKGIYDYENSPYAEILDVLKIVLEELVTSKMLIPRKIQGIESVLKYNTVDELIDQIVKSNLLENTFEFDIIGDTIIYTNTGEEIHSGIFELNSFRTFQQCFFISTKSDVWLPMAFDEDSYSFVWNIERYNLNYQRLPNVLNKIIKLLNWESFTAEVVYNELGTLQVKSDLFLSEEIITREFNSNPNTSFNLINYISKVSKSQI